MANCKSCGAEIIWIKTESGKAMPLDAHHDNAYVNFGDENEPYTKWKIMQCYKSHFATCPNANQHRREK